jgi:hypothetical protein
MLITKLLAARRLMRSTDHFVTLREGSIDVGPLKVVKLISPDTLDVIVPSMILQPLVRTDQARAGAEGRRRARDDHDDPEERARLHRGARRRPRHERGSARARAEAASASATSTNGCGRFKAKTTS